MTAPNAVVHTYGYDALNRLRALIISQGSTLIHTYEYKLRASGHRRQVIENSTKTTTYTYDDLYRLTDETVTADANANNGSIGYAFDKVGNRSGRTSSVASVSSVLNQSFNSRDWLNGDTYTANGSTLTSSTLPVALSPALPDVYDFEEHLILRTKPDGTTINVNYDADGHRVSKHIFGASAQPISSTFWLVDTNNLTGYAQVFEERTQISSPASQITKVYTYGSNLISQATSLNAQPSTLNYYIYDGHGSTRELTNASGSVTDRYDYDAFGILVFRSGPTANVFLYCGEQLDGDLGLYYNRARYLNPDSGRFWSMDSYEGSSSDPVSLHKYLYAHADPVNGLDPSGNSLVETIAGQTLAVRMQLSLIVPSIAAGGAVIGRVWNALGAATQNAASAVLQQLPKINVEPSVRTGKHIIDFGLSYGKRLAQLEVKYKLPDKLGSSMTRLVGQVNSMTANAQKGQAVVWTFKEPTAAEMNLFYQQVGGQARVQLVHGLEGLYRWATIFFGL